MEDIGARSFLVTERARSFNVPSPRLRGEGQGEGQSLLDAYQ